MAQEDKRHWTIFLIVALTIGGLLVYALNSFAVPVNNYFVTLPKKHVEPEVQEIDLKFKEDGEIDTSDWKTYQKEEYGFSIRYPRSRSLREYAGGISIEELTLNFESMKLASEDKIDREIQLDPELSIYKIDHYKGIKIYYVLSGGNSLDHEIMFIYNNVLFSIWLPGAYPEVWSDEAVAILNSLVLISE